MKKILYSCMLVLMFGTSHLFSMPTDQLDELALFVKKAAVPQEQAKDALYNRGARVARELARKKSHLSRAGVAGGGFLPQEQLLSQEDQRAYYYYLGKGGK